MATLSDLTAAIVSRLQSAQQPGGAAPQLTGAVILREDAHDLETEINKAIGQTGMLILVGQPHFTNTATLTNPAAQLKINTAIAIGELPALWRRPRADGQPRPHAVDAVQLVTQLLHHYKIDGFQPLCVLRGDFVPDKKRQLYEIPIETLLVVPTLPI